MRTEKEMEVPWQLVAEDRTKKSAYCFQTITVRSYAPPLEKKFLAMPLTVSFVRENV